jgi:hypothetical protein
MAVAKKLLTAEEFYRLGLEHAEFVEAEVVESMPTTPITLALGTPLRQWNKLVLPVTQVPSFT